jgi:hypothetical protein
MKALAAAIAIDLFDPAEFMEEAPGIRGPNRLVVFEKVGLD